MFLIPLMCWEYRDTLLMMRVHPSHRKTMSWGSTSTGLNESLWIHPRELELSVKARMWDPCPSFWMVMYIDLAEASNWIRFNVRTPCHFGGCARPIPWLYYCILWYHICMHHNIVWLLGSWRLCCLLVIIHLRPIGISLSRSGGLVCASTGDVVGLTYFLFSNVALVESGSTLLRRWCVQHDLACQ